MQVTQVLKFDDLTSYREDWRRLAARDPFIGWEWVSSWWKEYGDQVESYVLIVRDNDSNVVGIAPWIVDDCPTLGRRVRFLGTGKACSDYVRILVDEDNRIDVIMAIVDWLYAANRDGNPQTNWEYLSFDGVFRDEPGLQQLQDEFKARGYRVKEVPSNDCWRADLRCSWDDYVARLPNKKRRRKLRDVGKKYIDVGRTEFEYATTREQFDEFFELFVQLHQARRISLGEPGCFADERFGRFLRSAAERSFDRGELLLSRLLIDGQPAASSLGFLANGTHFVYQAGMNPDIQQHNCGWVMNVHTLRYAIDHGIQSVDYLRGDEVYKSKLGCEPVSMVQFRIVANQRTAINRNRWLRLRRHSNSVLMRIRKFLAN